MLSQSGSRAIAAHIRPTDAHLFAQTRTFRIIQLNGFACTTGLTDLAARAAAILANTHWIFISFRELKPTNHTHREGTSRFSSSVQLRTIWISRVSDEG